MKIKWSFDENVLQSFESLACIISPSMEETAMSSNLRNQWQKMGLDITTDVMGNIYTVMPTKKENMEKVLNLGIVAHMDTVAVQITNILPNGMLQFRSIGLQPHTLLGQPMKVITANGVINGVIGFDATSQYGQPKGLVLDDLWLDIGAKNYDEASRIVEIGDMSVLKPHMEEIGERYLCGAGIDDRIGLFILNECMKWFTAHRVYVNLYFIGTVQEEIGLRGANTAVTNFPLNACIVIDVDYATDIPASHENQMGILSMGKGVGLHVKADNNPILRRIAKEVATKEQIPYQMTLGRFTYGGTDSSPLQMQNNGIATLNVNVPCRYMHSPVEMCHKSDVESAIRLVIALVEELSSYKQCSFIPGID